MLHPSSSSPGTAAARLPIVRSLLQVCQKTLLVLQCDWQCSWLSDVRFIFLVYDSATHSSDALFASYDVMQDVRDRRPKHQLSNLTRHISGH